MAHFVIVGAGECGARAAFALREKGFDGDITLVGSEPLAPYERPPLSKGGSNAAPEPKFIAALERYREQSIDLKLDTTVTTIDPATKTIGFSEGQTLAYGKLLLTTGASARNLPGANGASHRIRMLRTHADAVALHAALHPGRHIAIIGGGFIGLELAATARTRGADVTVIEGLPRVLKRGVPEAIAEAITARHRLEGADIRCGQAIEAVREEGNRAVVRLVNGEAISADLLLVGIGAQPNVALAADAGLTLDNGIAVNERLETSIADIYAAGDCCSFPLALYGGRRVRLESWRNAHEQANLAAANMLGEGAEISAVPWFWSDQYDLTLQIAGLADDATVHVRRDLDDGAFILFHLGADGRLLAASGIGRGNAIARDIRLAEMLITARAYPDQTALAASSVKLKSLLAA
ncbi:MULTISPECIES: FAD-dependent oxidoreductase [unclassified Rhizobium]|jgi:3-phenylpropionate/trans-cinnamate dioxygenase ferredoxin reductase subunit|uniref:NAD(P)/FAD-dependent oxidoreductase n=1 Tax=unclassified Rhizobium TaxID=2613769 RepID=UPI000647E2C6|nr:MULTISPECIES: FAD-dependent oxidoreductase [unclassified Rhizobium]MBN8952542.1 FAD-dependent oxidoreductase [Rhizobium tropici]OJY64582.1 MAG: ferredoxin reductase [Rhizobium sp. 60-20]RKD72566.1 3-phenylpropionate/trans-cinnamate dioxygenase ferredoxin reductase subunit [Rhizobium sp. WW_1]